MNTLAPEDLIESLKACKPLTPLSIHDSVIEACIDVINEQRLTLNSDDPDSRHFRRSISDSLVFVDPQWRTMLFEHCECYFLPLPVCLAFSSVIKGRPVIVVSRGLTDIIAYTIYAAHLNNLIPPNFEQYHLLAYRRDMPLTDLFSNALLLFSIRNFCAGEPLPNTFAPLTGAVHRDCNIAISGAVTFILLHELGHLVLGHNDNDIARPIHYPQAVDEMLSPFQQQELEADKFALQCLHPAARAMGTYWHDHAINFFSQMELVSGARHNSHPLAINRRFMSDTLRGRWGKAFDLAPNPSHFETLRERFLATETETNKQKNLLLKTSREGALKVLEEILWILNENGVAMTEILYTPWQSWVERKDF